MTNFNEIRETLEGRKDRSAWDRGVTVYALSLLDDFEEWTEYAAENGEDAPALDEKTLLNGAEDWGAYSWGGSALVYDADIAARLCTPSELKRTDGGNRRPNAREEWLDVQARALRQASARLRWAARVARTLSV